MRRNGTEEFAIILPHTDLETARQLAEKARNRVYERNIPYGHSTVVDRVTISIGIGCLEPTPEFSSSVLIKTADEALYQAKGTGKNKVCPS